MYGVSRGVVFNVTYL